MNDKYELKKHNSTQLGRKILEVCHDYTLNYINKAELESILLHYVKTYPDILFEKNTIKHAIVNIIGKKRSIYILSLKAKELLSGNNILNHVWMKGKVRWT